jgi:plastocyanin
VCSSVPPRRTKNHWWSSGEWRKQSSRSEDRQLYVRASDLTVAAGTTVKWVNRDDIPHTVVSEDKRTFKSKALDTDDSFSYTFTQPGTYTYFCSIHPKMTAKVVVQ